MSKTIVFSNQKGGVGKTTSTVMLTGGLASRGYRVLLVDMDPQCSATDYVLGSRTGDAAHTVYDLIQDEELAVSDAIVQTEEYGDVMPGSEKMYDMDAQRHSVDYFVLNSIIDELKDSYDFVVIDTPPNLGWNQISSLMAGDVVVIPTLATQQSTRGIMTLITTIQSAKSSGNSYLTIGGILVVRSSARVNAVKKIVKDLEEAAGQWGTKVYEHRIRNAEALFGEAEIFHDNFFRRRERNRAKSDYDGFIDELLHDIESGEVCRR